MKVVGKEKKKKSNVRSSSILLRGREARDNSKNADIAIFGGKGESSSLERERKTVVLNLQAETSLPCRPGSSYAMGQVKPSCGKW